MKAAPAAALALSCLALPAAAKPGAPAVVHLGVGRPVTVSAAALLVSGLTGGRLDVAPWTAPVPAAPVPTAAEPGEVAAGQLLLGIELRPNVLEQLPPPWDLEIVTYVFTRDESVVATSSLALVLDSVADVHGIQVVDTLTLEPGDYVLRTLVRERASGELALAFTERRVLEASEDLPAALWMLRSAAGWVLGIADDEGAVPRLSVGEELVEAPAELIPAALVELAPGDLGRALLVLSDPTPSPAASVAIRDALGSDAAVVPVRLEPAAPGASAAARIASFTVPALEPGVHTLSFLVDGGETGRLAFVVPARGEGAAPERGPAADVTASLAGPQRSARAASALYRAVLAAEAAGDLTAVGALRGLEEGARGSARSGALRRLLQVESDVLSRLAAEAPLGLVGALSLHGKALAQYAGQGDSALEIHTMQVLLRMASALARRALPADRPRSAAALATAGSSLQAAGWSLQADRLLELALELDGSNRSALLAAAALRERAEDYPAAVTLLGSLVEAQPGDEEGRLRLALNLGRLRRAPEAKEILRSLAPGARTGWISVVAFQELARLEGADDLDAAIGTLEKGLERWPGEQGLVLLRIVLRDRRKPGEKTPVPTAFQRGESLGPAPRALYNRWPQAEADDDAVEAGRRALALWLERAGP